MTGSKDFPTVSDQEARRLGEVIIDVAIRLGFIALLVWWSLVLISPFVIVVVWAVIMTVALYPVYAWLRDRLGRGSWSALLITLIGLAIILGPAAVLTTNMIGTVESVSAGLSSGTLTAPPPPESLKSVPLIGPKAHTAWASAAANLAGFVAQHGDTVLKAGGAVLGSAAGLAGSVLLFAVSVIISGFLYGPGPKMADGARAFGRRVVGERGAEFVDMAGATIRNVSRGVIGISLAQALLLGIGMLVAGVPAAGILTFVILILCIIQIGPGIIVLPVLIWAWSSMGTLAAAVFTAYMLVATFGDSAVKPVVMAKGLSTPMLVIFIGVIGGTLAHGLIGLFLGPIVLAVFYELLIAWVKLGETPDEGAAE